MKNGFQLSEKGQSLVLLAVLMLVFLGMLGFVIDGGMAYANRRLAQTAADAGALAGAAEYCKTGNSGTAITTATEYAVTRNRAETADVSMADGVVTVIAHIPYETFFAGLFGRPDITASAIASAGCFAPGSGIGILPIAWACSPTIGGTIGDHCERQYGPDNLYIIMDSQNVEGDFQCQEPPNSGTPEGTLDCDLDDDGFNDLLAGGDRSWLDLSGGGGGAFDLRNWVLNGFPDRIQIHTWFGGQTGVANTVYQAVDQRVGDEVLVPVFDQFCDGVPATTCPEIYHPNLDNPAEDITVLSGGASVLYFHIITFSVFHINCVDAPGVPIHCPGHDWAVSLGTIPDNAKTIEGYFIEDWDPDLGGKPGDGIYGGAYTVFLIR